MLMARHEPSVVSRKVLEQLNYLTLVVVSKACRSRAGKPNWRTQIAQFGMSINDVYRKMPVPFILSFQ
jgi:hypothetical protein